MQIAWIGTGVMGSAMAGHLLAAGHELTLYSRTKSKAIGLLQRGARLGAQALILALERLNDIAPVPTPPATPLHQ